MLKGGSARRCLPCLSRVPSSTQHVLTELHIVLGQHDATHGLTGTHERASHAMGSMGATATKLQRRHQVLKGGNCCLPCLSRVPSSTQTVLARSSSACTLQRLAPVSAHMTQRSLQHSHI